MPQALKSCPKCNKSPNLVTLLLADPKEATRGQKGRDRLYMLIILWLSQAAFDACVCSKRLCKVRDFYNFPNCNLHQQLDACIKQNSCESFYVGFSSHIQERHLSCNQFIHSLHFFFYVVDWKPVWLAKQLNPNK